MDWEHYREDTRPLRTPTSIPRLAPGTFNARALDVSDASGLPRYLRGEIEVFSWFAEICELDDVNWSVLEKKVCPHNDWGREYRVLARAEEASGNYARTIIFQYCVCDDAASSHDMNIFAYAEGTSWSCSSVDVTFGGTRKRSIDFFPFLGPFFRRMPQYVWTRAEPYALDKLHAIEDFEDYRRHKEEFCRYNWYMPRSTYECGRVPADLMVSPLEQVEKSCLAAKPPPSVKRDCRGINPIARVLLIGCRDPASCLSRLPDEIVRKIYEMLRRWWHDQIDVRGVHASLLCTVSFPPSRGLNVNMMPIVLGDSESVPEALRHYIPLLAACPINREEWGKIGYLTIHESTVSEDGQSQRRPGIHAESPGKVSMMPSSRDYDAASPNASEWRIQVDPPLTTHWGSGLFDGTRSFEYCGGIYMASNVADSTIVWNCAVPRSGDLTGDLGDLSHLRGVLGKGKLLKRGELLWITDLTPHASMPLPAGVHRQYFRLVTSDVSVWYADHSTPNPNPSIVPPDSVTIITGSKFS